MDKSIFEAGLEMLVSVCPCECGSFSLSLPLPEVVPNILENRKMAVLE